MATLYVGANHAYRDEITMARAESAQAAANAPTAETLDWDARLVYRVSHDNLVEYTTDGVEVMHMVAKHPECNVRVLSVH